MFYYPHAVIVLTLEEATSLAKAVLAIQRQLDRQAASLPKPTLRLSKDIISAAGKTENIPPDTCEDIEYEQITVAEAAKILDCGDRNVTHLINHNKLTGQKRGGRWLLNREEVESLKAHRDNRSAHK